MNDDNKTLEQTIIALKRQILLERLLMIVITITIVIFAFVFSLHLIALIEGHDILSDRRVRSGAITGLIVFSLIFTFQSIVVIYFVQMGTSYVNILSEFYTIKKRLISVSIYLLGFIVILTNLRAEIINSID